jgi:hypothetical protein
MQIGSGPSPLSLAMLKTLGIEVPAGAPAGAAPRPAAPAAAEVPEAPQRAVERTVAAGAQGDDPGGDLGVARSIPRGSFVDLKV